MKMKLPILFENTDYVVINKPAGLVVHSDGKTNEPSVADWVLENYPKTAKVGEPMTLSDGTIIPRPGIVHRIDRETSGILVIAKTQKSFLALKEQFQNRLVKKSYNAFLYGELKVKEGIIDRQIGRSKSDFRKWSAERGARGEMRDAVTAYTVLETAKGFSYIEANPKTGRTHQIRVHFKAINHPLVADSLYAPGQPPALGFERLALHAASIAFMGMKGEEIQVSAKLPKDFVEALKELRN